MPLDSLIEAVLFWKAEPVAVADLAKQLEQSEEQVRTALIFLRGKLEGRGLVLVEKDNEVMLGTQPEAAAVIEKLAKEELSRDLGKAALETLTIVLYKGPVPRAEIDYIRGVNSSFILRNLQIRGLVEKVANPNDSRSWLYRPTFALLQHLGVGKIDELPEFGTLVDQINQFAETKNPEA